VCDGLKFLEKLAEVEIVARVDFDGDAGGKWRVRTILKYVISSAQRGSPWVFANIVSVSIVVGNDVETMVFVVTLQILRANAESAYPANGRCDSWSLVTSQPQHCLLFLTSGKMV
jgi:hypothetical protein